MREEAVILHYVTRKLSKPSQISFLAVNEDGTADIRRSGNENRTLYYRLEFVLFLYHFRFKYLTNSRLNFMEITCSNQYLHHALMHGFLLTGKYAQK